MPSPTTHTSSPGPGPTRTLDRRRSLALAALLAAGVGPACLLVVGGAKPSALRVHETRHLQVEHRSAADLVIDNPNGSVQIDAGAAGEVKIEARLAARDRDRLARAEPYAERLPDGTLEIGVRWPDGGRKSDEGADLSVRLPDAGLVRVRASNGSVRVKGVGDEVDLLSSNGAIDVRGVSGDVRARTSNGPIDVHGGHRVDLTTSNARVRVFAATGPLEARTSNGGLEVELDPGNPGPVDLIGSNGSVRLSIGPAFDGRLDLETSNGRLRLDGAPLARLHALGSTSAELSIGSSGTVSRVRTSNGQISLRVVADGEGGRK